MWGDCDERVGRKVHKGEKNPRKSFGQLFFSPLGSTLSEHFRRLDLVTHFPGILFFPPPQLEIALSSLPLAWSLVGPFPYFSILSHPAIAMPMLQLFETSGHLRYLRHGTALIFLHQEMSEG